MSAPAARPPLVVVTGPTASGKTAVAIALAEKFGGEIINADSMQVFRFMDIGTAKPSAEQRARVPHHLLDVVTPDVDYSAGRYAGDARRAAAAIHARGALPFLVGGSGLYIRAMLEGLIGDAAADPELRDRLEAEHAMAVEQGEPGRLHERLAALDPEAARTIHPNDTRRVIRALEICERTGLASSRVRREQAFADRPYRSLHLALDPGREALDVRIDARCVEMVEAGLLQEVRNLRARGYGPELRPMQAIGYRHLGPVVDGLDILANALVAMQRDTRRFARRQRTWLRALEDVVWVHPDDGAGIERRVREFLESGDQ